jgi:enoyl-CoA hydratase/carnithine racemase
MKVVAAGASGALGAQLVPHQGPKVSESKDGVVDQAASSTQRVTVSIDAGVASVRLNRADKLNALDVPMLAALVDAGEQLKQESSDARFSVLEIRWGLVPDTTGTAMLPLLVGLDVAKELSFTGRTVSAEEAARIGLVTRVSDSPLDDALALAHEIARRSPQAIRGVKKLLDRARYASLAEQFRDERETIKPLLGSKNQVEAVMAHLEKRDPVFED